MSTPAAPAGWYDDGQHPGQQRYWDGEQWTEHFHPPQLPPAPGEAPGPVRRSRRYWAWLAPVIVVVVAGGTVLGLALGGVFGGDSPANAVDRLIAGVNERNCAQIIDATTVELGGSLASYYCSEVEPGDTVAMLSFRTTQTILTGQGATVLGVLVQTERDMTHSDCFAMMTVIDRGHWRVNSLGSDGFPSDIELDSSAPGYCTGTPGLTE